MTRFLRQVSSYTGIALLFACSHMANRPKHISDVQRLMGLGRPEVNKSLGQPGEVLRSSQLIEVYYLNDQGPNNPEPTPVRYKLIYDAQNRLVGLEKDK